MLLKTKVVGGALAGVMTLALGGAAALAAFQPGEALATGSVRADTTAPAAATERGKGVEVLTDVLARLVASGTITADQQAKILEAVKTAADPERPKRPAPGQLKRIWASFQRLSFAYLGVAKDELNAALRSGQSLGEVAAATDGKSRQGLIDHLVAEATALIDKGVAEEHLTEDQAAEAKSRLLERVTSFVDHVYQKKPAPRAGERLKEKVEQAKKRADQLAKQAKKSADRAEKHIEKLKERLEKARDGLKAPDRDDDAEDEDDTDDD